MSTQRTSIFTPRKFDAKEVRIYNPHYLLVDSNNATQDQVEANVEQLFQKAKKFCKHLEPGFRVNTVVFTKKQPNEMIKEPSGYSYVWVKDLRFFHMLLGKNPDGTERFIEKNDETWIAPTSDYEIAWFKEENGVQVKRRWWEIVEEEEAEEAKRICPKIKIHLPPIFEMVKISLNEKQIRHLESKGIFGVKSHTLKFTAAHIGAEAEKSCIHTLVCKNIPNYITEADIKAIFVPYVENPLITSSRRQGTQYIVETYPLIAIKTNNYGNMAFITFDHHAQDARFAFLMTKQYSFNKRINGRDMSATLYFELSNK